MTEYRLTVSDVVVRTADDAQIPSDPANSDRAAYLVWLANGGVPDPYVAPESPPPFLVPPRIVAAALDMVVTPESWDISNSNGMFNIVAAMYLDVGTYWMFFTNPEADSNYFGVITGADVAQITITDRSTDYFAIEARDGSGVLTDTRKLSVQIVRIAT
jgi:hypothetical protein